MFRVIIAGGRDFKNYNLLEEKCDRLLSQREKDDIVIISGEPLVSTLWGLNMRIKGDIKQGCLYPIGTNTENRLALLETLKCPKMPML